MYGFSRWDYLNETSSTCAPTQDPGLNSLTILYEATSGRLQPAEEIGWIRADRPKTQDPRPKTQVKPNVGTDIWLMSYTHTRTKNTCQIRVCSVKLVRSNPRLCFLDSSMELATSHMLDSKLDQFDRLAQLACIIRSTAKGHVGSS